jgi:hypothetical protein
MVRSFDVIMIVAVIASAAWTFKVKADSESALQRVAVLERRIELEREAIDLLKADWSLLTSPERLQKLVERYREELGLEPATALHIGKVGEIPLRDQLNGADAEGSRQAAGEGAKAEVETGSIEKKAGQ